MPCCTRSPSSSPASPTPTTGAGPAIRREAITIAARTFELHGARSRGGSRRRHREADDRAGRAGLDVVAVEPLDEMRARLRDVDAEVVDAAAEDLPFADGSLAACLQRRRLPLVRRRCRGGRAAPRAAPPRRRRAAVAPAGLEGRAARLGHAASAPCSTGSAPIIRASRPTRAAPASTATAASIRSPARALLHGPDRPRPAARQRGVDQLRRREPRPRPHARRGPRDAARRRAARRPLRTDIWLTRKRSALAVRPGR